MYGMWPQGCPNAYQPIVLHPAMTLKSSIIHIKDLPAGSSISYGRHFVTPKDNVIATIPIGYADGYLRGLSNKAHAILRGCFAPVVGRISMDVCALDVTDIPAAMPGDRVTLIGEQDGLTVTAHELAELMGTISYEVLTGISKRVPRVYIDRRT